MKKLLLILIIISILLTACTVSEEKTEELDEPEEIETEEQEDTSTDIVTPYQTQYLYSEFVEGCDRFRPIYEQELSKYPRLTNIIDVPTAIALSYQESTCRTRQEIYEDFKREERLDNPTWKGGIMQVDSCWRWGAPSACDSVQDQIASGVKELDFGLEKIQDELNRLGITDLSAEQELTLLLLAYNRGFYVSNQAMQHYVQEDFPHIILVECTEKDVCANDGEELNISEELEGLDDFEQSLLIACRENYGYMNNGIGDYCTGPDYGINYPKKILGIRESMLEDDATARNPYWSPKQQKEFYIGSTEFAGYEWFIKTSLNQTGPGPNYFYLNETSVYTDAEGRLHLHLLKENNRWYSSEVVLTESLGYGLYEFEVEGPIVIEASTVIGLFTYDIELQNDENWHHREIDIEFAQWNNPLIENTQFIIQPGDNAQHRFETDTNKDSTISFDWREDKISYVMKQEGELVQEWEYTGQYIPTPGNEKTRINLWSFKEAQEPQHIIIKNFRYEP